jgi:hypothetical protein
VLSEHLGGEEQAQTAPLFGFGVVILQPGELFEQLFALCRLKSGSLVPHFHNRLAPLGGDL